MHINLLIASDHTSQCAVLAEELDRQFGSYIATRWTDIANLVACAAQALPDVLLIDNAPRSDGVPALVSQVRLAHPGIRVLLLFHACAEELVIEWVMEEAHAPGPHEAAPSEGAPRIIRAGEIWFGRGALIQACKSLVRVAPGTHLVDNGILTAREGEILHLVGAGLSNKEVARRLLISDQTVKTHLHHIYRKLHRSGRYKAFLSQLPAPEDAGQGAGAGGAPAHLF
ncbi:MAG: response regulator transcription factor [Ramlibacter sp.]|nr:response regulator transcription factor [Ramlibacter sp.]